MYKLKKEEIKELISKGLSIKQFYIASDEFHLPFQVSFKKTNYTGTIRIDTSPTGNCQALTIGNAKSLLNGNHYARSIGNDKYLEILIGFLSCRISKRIYHMDIREYNLVKMKKLFKPYVKTFGIRRYKSTNNSNMVLCHIEIDFEKYKELGEHYSEVFNSNDLFSYDIYDAVRRPGQRIV